MIGEEQEDVSCLDIPLLPHEFVLPHRQDRRLVCFFDE